jgi:hypothetical protein
MGVLLMLVGLLTLMSGAVKLRGRIRSTVGYSPLAVVETLCGLVVLLGSGLGLSRIRPLAWSAVAVLLGLILVSTWTQIRRIAHRHKKRELSEEWRLKAYLLDDSSGGASSSQVD